MTARALVLTIVYCLPTTLFAQQVPDTAFRPLLQRPAYAVGTGPVILIDEGHSNLKTSTGGYFPFAELLRRDGYIVRGSPGFVTAETIRGASVLVSASAREPFNDAEVSLLQDWVKAGGAILLIVDHPPGSRADAFGTPLRNVIEAARNLADAFGIRLRNAAARDPRRTPSGRLVFRRSDGTLVNHAITRGIDSVATFGGSSFQLEVPGEPLLVFGPGVYAYPQRNEPNPLPLQGNFQGAVLQFGKGRVAAFAEAAMFSAQLSGPSRSPMGMNAPIAGQNAAFLLNLLHWLVGPL
ncbi:MAG TPA: DUF4350 domain-containing protein [Gemmatimonadaceae bacterium]|nr:DUF4350 domain-containing protein [Gemmatimonadaceae bacterium]